MMHPPGTATPLPELHRSNLIVPVTQQRFVESAHRRGADCVTLDLEDGVAPSEKERAWKALEHSVELVVRGGCRVEVRVNRPMRLLVLDIEAAVLPGVSAIRLPKVESAGEVQRVSELILELENERGLAPFSIGLQALIETPAGLLAAASIARADPRLTSIGLGCLDLAAACGFAASVENLAAPSQMVVVAARAAGIKARGLAGAVGNFSDLEAFRQLARRSRLMGLTEGGAIHPSQVPILNEEFGVSEVEIHQAQEILAMAQLHFSQGVGAFAYRGQMIDRPIVEAARHTLAIAEAVVAARDRLSVT